MTSTIAANFGFETQPGTPLVDWEAIAAQWHVVIERTMRRCRGLDAPFVHAEHGNMHSFMVAAEMAGWSTMREMLGNRGSAEGPQGRLDGCFIGETSVDLVEAKAGEFAIARTGDLRRVDFERCQNLMRAAVVDANLYFNRHRMFLPFPLPKRRIGIAFYYGYLTDDPTDGDPWLTAYLAKLRTIEHDVMAWSFPNLARGMRYHQPNRHYPGVVMLATLGKIEPAADPATTA